MDEEYLQQLGRHEADIATLKKQLDGMEDKLDAVVEILAAAKGGWRTLMLVGGSAAGIGALMSQLFHWR